jgi:hypothetical protein
VYEAAEAVAALAIVPGWSETLAGPTVRSL